MTVDIVRRPWLQTTVGTFEDVLEERAAVALNALPSLSGRQGPSLTVVTA